MANIKKLLEEELQEAACFGDLEHVTELISKGVNVNCKHIINKWSPLHWAAYRNNLSIVKILLENGADKNSLNKKGETPAQLSTNSEIVELLGEKFTNPQLPKLPIVPNYLKNPPISVSSSNNTITLNEPVKEEFILKIRIEGETDFIEVEFPKSESNFEKLKEVCCKELSIDEKKFKYLRKLPNTKLRNDKDVLRLKNYQELEVLLFVD